MKNTLIILVLLTVVFQTNAQEVKQETSLSKLVKLLHQQELEFRLEMIAQIKQSENSDKTIEKVAIANTLYEKFEAIYQDTFTIKDIEELYTFYNSKLGKKLLKNKSELGIKISAIAMEWEMEQQGISIEAQKPPIYRVEDGKLIDEKGNVVEESIAVPIEQEKLPEITNLEELKKIVRKTPYMIGDQNLLIALFGQEEIDDLFKQAYLEQVDEDKKLKNKN